MLGLLIDALIRYMTSTAWPATPRVPAACGVQVLLIMSSDLGLLTIIFGMTPAAATPGTARQGIQVDDGPPACP